MIYSLLFVNNLNVSVNLIFRKFMEFYSFSTLIGVVHFFTQTIVIMIEKKLKYEDRLVHFAAETIGFCKTLPKDNVGEYYANQLIRSTGSSALHYGEAQGTNTVKDFIHKVSNVVKELKETRVAMKIIAYTKIGDSESGKKLLEEVEELIAIGARMILNKKK